MKLWKKIVLIVSTLIIVISTMVLPVFANDYVVNTGNEITIGYNYDASLIIEDYNPEVITDNPKSIIYDLPSQFVVKNDLDDRQSQSFKGRMLAYPMRNSNPAVSSQRDLEFLGVIYNHTSHTNLVGEGAYSVEYQGIKPGGLDVLEAHRIRLNINNFIYNKESVKQIVLRFAKRPDQQYEDYYINVRINVAEPVYNVDTGEITYINHPYSYTKRIFEEGYESTIGLIDPNLIYNSNYWIEDNGVREVFEHNGTNIVYINSVEAEIHNTQDEPINDSVVLEYFAIDMPFGNMYNMGNGNYERSIGPDNYLWYNEHVAEIYSGERKIIQPVTFDGDFWSFIQTSISGFFDFELLPGMSIGGMVLTLVGIVLFIVLLKVFVGG